MKDSLSEIRFRKNIPTSEKFAIHKKTGQFKIVWSILNRGCSLIKAGLIENFSKSFILLFCGLDNTRISLSQSM